MVHAYLAMDGCMANMSKLFLTMLGFFALHDGICGSGAFTIAQTQNMDKDSFDMLYKKDCWAAIPDPIWTTNVPYERNINMLSSTNNNFMIIFFRFWEI